MARITVEDCLQKIPNRFALVMLVAKRAKQIMRGSKTLVTTKDNKPIVTALREVAATKVWYEVDETIGTQNEQVEKDLAR